MIGLRLESYGFRRILKIKTTSIAKEFGAKMKYSQKSVEKELDRLNGPAKKHKYRRESIWNYVRGAFIVFLLCIGIYQCISFVGEVIEGTEKIHQMDILSGNTGKTVLYDGQGKKLQELNASAVNQQYVMFKDIPESVTQAFVVGQDPNFYQHHGVDMQQLIKELSASVLQQGEQDVKETITQQLIANQILEEEATNGVVERLRQTIGEQYLAISLEEDIDKEKILEYYLNTINLGNNIVGVQVAAQRFFNKSISDVTISEAAVLAATVDDPVGADPVVSQSVNAANRKKILKEMLEKHYISEAEYEDALGDDVYSRIQSNHTVTTDASDKVNSYYVDATLKQVIKDLREHLGYSQTQAYNAVYRKGVKIYTCEDLEIQKLCEEGINNDKYYPEGTKSQLSYSLVIEKEGKSFSYNEDDLKNYYAVEEKKQISLNFSSESKAKEIIKKFKKDVLKDGGSVKSENVMLVKEPQASMVVIEQRTGEVKAIVGGRGQKIANRSIDRATEAEYQPGATFDLLASYTPALDTAGYTLATVKEDTKYLYPDTVTPVHRWRTGDYYGLIRMREAISKYSGIYAVKTLEDISIRTSKSYLERFGISTEVEQRVAMSDGEMQKQSKESEYSLALGELEVGVTNLELTSAYTVFANQGRYVMPRLYTKVLDQDGNLLLDNQLQSRQVIKKSTAWLIANTLDDVTEDIIEEQKNTKIATSGREGFTVAGDDCWYEGFTPYYTVGIWLGQDEEDASESYILQSEQIWRDIMQKIHERKGLVGGSLSQADGLVLRNICNTCGKLAVEGLCDKAESGNEISREYFVKGTEPTDYCTCHVKYAFCKSSDKLATEDCPEKNCFYRVLLEKEEKGDTEDTPYLSSRYFIKGNCEIHAQNTKTK